MTGATPSFDLRRLVDAAEERILACCALVPAMIAPELARAEGTLRGAPVSIETHAWVGAKGSPIAYARFVSMRGEEVDVGNVVCLPEPRAALPILGADLVALTPRAGMIAADLSPTLPPGELREAQLEDYARRRALHPALPPGGDLPRFCADFFSPHHVYTRFGLAERGAAARIFDDLVGAFAALVQRARGQLEVTGKTHSAAASVGHAEALAASATLRAYLDAHRADEMGLEVLSRAFGRPWALRYVHDVMFPITAPAADITRSGSHEEAASP